MKRAYLATLTITLLTATSAYAVNCATVPTCAELGYTDTVANCSGDSIKCPFDLTVGKCIGSGATVGQIGYFPYEVKDVKWIKCDGRFLHKDAYPELYEVLKTTFGGSGNAFRIPDYKGDFVRVNGRDSGTVTSRQSEGLPNIYGHFGMNSKTNADGVLFSKTTMSSNYEGIGNGDMTKGAIRFDASKYNSIYGSSSHVTPVNTSVYAYIYAGKLDTSKGTAKDIMKDCAKGYYYYTDGTCSSSRNTSKTLRGVVAYTVNGPYNYYVRYITGGISTASSISTATTYCKNNYLNGNLGSLSEADIIPASISSYFYKITNGRTYWYSGNAYKCTGTTYSTCTRETSIPTTAYYYCEGTDYFNEN